MSRKHNTKHRRGRSHYGERLWGTVALRTCTPEERWERVMEWVNRELEVA